MTPLPDPSPVAAATTTGPPPRGPRMVSLDLFRGLTIAGMILVNNPGSRPDAYPPLLHSEWNGLTPTDVVYPFFLFIVGFAVKLSLDKALTSGASRGAIAWHVVRRGLVLFVIGMLLNNFPSYHFPTLRIPGILQRIAVCYVLASCIYLRLAQLREGRVQFSPRPLLWICGALMLGYYLLVRFLSPGAWDTPAGNLTFYIDRLVLGTAHLRKGAVESTGILSTATALTTTLSGILCAWWMRQQRDPYEKLALLMVAGAASLLVGYIASALFPVNKDIWSSSYVFVTSGLAALFLGLCHWYADLQGRRAGVAPFLWFGTNAITAYIASELGAELMIKTGWREDIFQSIAPALGPHNAALAYAIVYTAFWACVMWVLYRRRIFIKV